MSFMKSSTLIEKKTIVGMHSMSKEFYNYLAQRTVDFFQSTLVPEGEKYILNFNDEHEVRSFYEALDSLLQYAS